MALLLKLGMLTAGMDPLAAMDPRAASSSNPARDPWEGKGWVLQLRKVSSLSMLPKRSSDLYWKRFFLRKFENLLKFVLTKFLMQRYVLQAQDTTIDKKIKKYSYRLPLKENENFISLLLRFFLQNFLTKWCVL